jgi:hypothetical protein
MFKTYIAVRHQSMPKWHVTRIMSATGHSLQGRIGSKSSNVRCAGESGSKFRESPPHPDRI